MRIAHDGLYCLHARDVSPMVAPPNFVSDDTELCDLHDVFQQVLAWPSACVTSSRTSSPTAIKRPCAGDASAPKLSRLQPFRDLAESIQKHWSRVVSFLKARLTNGAIEAVNGLLQLARRLARGFPSLRYFRIMAYLKAASLDLDLPSLKPLLPTQNSEWPFFGFTGKSLTVSRAARNLRPLREFRLHR
jgi:hypothetical protein